MPRWNIAQGGRNNNWLAIEKAFSLSYKRGMEAKEIIERLMEVGVSVRCIQRAIGCSHRAVYDWKNEGVEPRRANRVKLELLYRRYVGRKK